jgi:hypothetical protein
MSTRYLLVVSSVMLTLGLVGLLVFWRLHAALPPDLAGLRSLDAKQPAAEIRARVDPYLEAARSGRGRFLVPREAKAVRDTADAYAAAPSDPAIIDKLGDAIFQFRRYASVAAIHGIVLSCALAVAGLLGLLRSRIPRAVVIAVTILSFVVVFGGASLFFSCERHLAMLLLSPLVLGALGQVIAANLLPGKPHPLVATAEARLRRLSPAQRRTFIAIRLVGGALLLGGGLALSILSTLMLKAIGAGLSIVFVGAIVAGLFMMTVPTITVIRMRVARRKR